MEEVWKPIEGYEGYYQVSNLGRIKSLKRKGIPKDRIKKQTMMWAGYMHVTIQKKRKVVTKRVHRLVAKAFVPNPNHYKEINHIDLNKTNNIHTNLEWCTRKQNVRHFINKNGKVAFQKLTKEQVLEIRKRYNRRTCNNRVLAKEYGISRSHCSHIVIGRVWKNV